MAQEKKKYSWPMRGGDLVDLASLIEEDTVKVKLPPGFDGRIKGELTGRGEKARIDGCLLWDGEAIEIGGRVIFLGEAATAFSAGRKKKQL